MTEARVVLTVLAVLLGLLVAVTFRDVFSGVPTACERGSSLAQQEVCEP